MDRVRLFSVLIVFLLAGGDRVATAQISFDGGIAFGANVATLHAASDDHLDYRTAATGGLFGEVGVVGPLAVRGELLISPKGARVDTDQGELTLKANYAELPILLVGRLPFARRYAPRLVAGPALGLKLYERQGAPGLSFRTEQTAFTRTDAGVVVGAGASLGGPGAFAIEVRYTYGMVDVTREVSASPLDEAWPADGKNGVVSVLLRFGLNP